MKMSFKQMRKWSFVAILLGVLVVSCDKDNEDNPDKEVEAYVTETKEKIEGEWILVSSAEDGELIENNAFAALKESKANFEADNTYSVVYKSVTATGTSIVTKSGTYQVTGVNEVTFYNSTSKIKYVDGRIEISSELTEGGSTKTRVDIFVRSDSDELKEEKPEDSDIEVVEEEDEPDDTDTYDGSAVIAKLIGKWKIEGVTDACMQNNTLEFKEEGLLEFIQHKATFNRADLRKYNINVSYPMPAKFKATMTVGGTTVFFDTEADCQFIKKSNLQYLVQDEITVAIKNVPQLKLKLESDNVIKMEYSYSDSKNQEKTVVYTYKK